MLVTLVAANKPYTQDPDQQIVFLRGCMLLPEADGLLEDRAIELCIAHALPEHLPIQARLFTGKEKLPSFFRECNGSGMPYKGLQTETNQPGGHVPCFPALEPVRCSSCTSWLPWQARRIMLGCRKPTCQLPRLASAMAWCPGSALGQASWRACVGGGRQANVCPRIVLDRTGPVLQTCMSFTQQAHMINAFLSKFGWHVVTRSCKLMRHEVRKSLCRVSARALVHHIDDGFFTLPGDKSNTPLICSNSLKP